MDIDKFEYWAKRQGLSCVKFRTKDSYSTYTSEDTERAFLYWLDAFSPQVQQSFDTQKELKAKYKDSVVSNDVVIEAVSSVVNDLCATDKNLDWLYKFSAPKETEHEFVLRSLTSTKRNSIKYIKELGELINLSDLFIWQTRDDYPSVRAKVSLALNRAANPVYSNGPLEAAIADRFKDVVFLQKGNIYKDRREYKFSENVVNLALELSL